MISIKRKIIALALVFGTLLLGVANIDAYGPIFFNVGSTGRGSSTIGLAGNKYAPNNSATTMDSLNEYAYNEVQMKVYFDTLILSTKNHGSSGYVSVSYNNTASTRLMTTHKNGGTTVTKINYR